MYLQINTGHIVVNKEITSIHILNQNAPNIGAFGFIKE